MLSVYLFSKKYMRENQVERISGSHGGSSAEAASLLTTAWGIRLTSDDDMNNPKLTSFIEHSLTAGI
jgi:hypothetical protein